MTSKMSNNLPFFTVDKSSSSFEPQHTLNQNTGNQENYAVESYQPPILNPNNSNQQNAPNIYSNQIVLVDNELNYPVQNNPVMPPDN